MNMDPAELMKQKSKLKQGTPTVERHGGFVADYSPLPPPSEVFPHLYVSGALTSVDIPLLHSLSITHVLNCAPIAVATPPESSRDGIVWHEIDIRDIPDFPLESVLSDALKFISTALKTSDSSVVVNCSEGRSRSVTVIVAFLMICKDMSLDNAMDLIHKNRPNACPNRGFMDFLKMIDKMDRSRLRNDYEVSLV